MLKARRPMGRLFRWFLLLVVLGPCVTQVRAAGPNTTTVTDVIYRADGSAAQGTLLISWPAFTAKGSEPVAAGSMSVKIGVGGAVRIPLVPNTGATPTGTHYTVVLKLDNGTTSTEYWTVPDAGTTTVSAIRSKVVPATVAAQLVARDYVDSALAGVSGDFVVHKNGAETITGAKTFAAPPTVPEPVASTDAANKLYVDGAIQKIAASGTLSAATSLPVAGTAGATALLTAAAKGPYFDTGSNWSPFHTELSLADYGAVGDGKSYQTSSITAGSKTLSSWGFTSNDVGKKALVKGAGAGGADLVTRITAVANDTTATLQDAASTSVTGAGAYWGTSLDDSGAFTAALAVCKGDQTLQSRSGGCTLKVPPGKYSINLEQTIANWNAYSVTNRVTIECVGGYATTMLVWTGAANGDVFRVDDSTMKAPPVSIKNCGFMGVDSTHSLGAAMHVVGGVSHEFSGNYVGANVRYGAEWSQTWLGRIEFNQFYGPSEAIRFDNSCNTFASALGHGTPGCPVNSVTIANNEFGLNPAYSIHSVATGQGGSNGNTYGPGNDLEGTMATALAAMELNDSDSHIIGNRFEDGGSTDPSYRSLRMTGARNEITNNNMGTVVSTGSNIFTGNYMWTIESSASNTAPDIAVGNYMYAEPTVPDPAGLVRIGSNKDWRLGYRVMYDDGHDMSLKQGGAVSNPQKVMTQQFGIMTISSASPILVNGKSVPNTPAGATFGFATYPGQYSSIVWNDRASQCSASSYPEGCVLGWACKSTGLSDRCVSTGNGNYSSGSWIPIPLRDGLRGTAALGTGAISSGACTTVTVAATGVLTTDVIAASFNGDPTGVTGYVPASTGMLTVIPYPTTDNVNFKVCNNTASTITPGAITLNWKVLQ